MSETVKAPKSGHSWCPDFRQTQALKFERRNCPKSEHIKLDRFGNLGSYKFIYSQRLKTERSVF